MIPWLLIVTSPAVEPSLIAARLAEVAPLRAQRLASRAPALPEEAYAKAASGSIPTGLEAVEGQSARIAWGLAVVDEPIGPVWAAINDDPSKVEWTKLDYVEVFEGGACGNPRRVFQYLPVPMFTDRWWVTVMRKNDPIQAASGGRVREMRWASDGDFTLPTPTAAAWGEKGMHVAFTEGAWFLVDLDGKNTLIEYYTFSDPGGSVPARMASSLAANGIDDTIRAMVTGARSGPRCKIE